MSKASGIADRHERAVAGLDDATRPLIVRIVAGDQLHGPANQHLLACLCNLLCRMARVVSAIEIEAAEAPWRAATGWPMGQGTVVDRMRALSIWATGGLVAVREASAERCDIVICVGDRAVGYEGEIDLMVLGAGWLAWAGDEDHAPRLSPAERQSDNPLGPYLAACLAAGEVFKRARGLKRGRFATDLGYSLWTGEAGPWVNLVDGPPLAGKSLPPFYLVGAGAVGQALHAILAALRLSNAYVVTIDDDSHDETNLNRCVLAGIEDERHPKLEVVTKARHAAGLDGYEFQGTLSQYVQRPHRAQLRPDLATSEAEDQYGVVVSAVDKNTSRHDIQGLRPDIVVGGSTLGLTAKANVYDMAAGTACLGCYNPPEDDGARLREVEQQVRGMSDAELRQHLAGKVENLDAVVSYLNSTEQCGQVGEAEFRNFATARDPEFSVSFVSMAAALLLASRLLGRTLFPEADERRRRMSTLAFRNLETGDDSLCQDPHCRHCRAAGRLGDRTR